MVSLVQDAIPLILNVITASYAIFFILRHLASIYTLTTAFLQAQQCTKHVASKYKSEMESKSTAFLSGAHHRHKGGFGVREELSQVDVMGLKNSTKRLRDSIEVGVAEDAVKGDAKMRGCMVRLSSTKKNHRSRSSERLQPAWEGSLGHQQRDHRHSERSYSSAMAVAPQFRDEKLSIVPNNGAR